MTEFGRSRKLVRPEYIPIAVGALIGGGMGAVIRGSGLFYTNVFLAAGLLAFVAVVALVALWALLTGRKGTAVGLGWFIAAIIVAAAVAYTFAPHYRSPDAGTDYPGKVTVHLAEPAATEWVLHGRCSTVPDRGLMVISTTGMETVDGAYTTVLLHLDMNATAAPVLLAISRSTAKAGSANYSLSGGNGLEATGIAPDGLHGTVRFSVPAWSGGGSRGQQPDRLSGTVVWECS